MKKTAILLCLALCLFFSGCAKGDEISTSAETTENEIHTQNDIQETADTTDIDLTTLSSTMVYSEIYNMLITPDDYTGKRIKMAGQLFSYTDEETSEKHYACVIQDATACCQQGFEFVLADENFDFPADDTDIEVTGTFDTYNEGELIYCHLIDCSINVL